jgi:hypothetical protein
VDSAVVDSAVVDSAAVDDAVNLEWTPTSWLGVRLMAVCKLAQAHDVKPLTDDVYALPKLT